MAGMLTEALRGVLPAELGARLAAGEGWSVESSGQPLTPQPSRPEEGEVAQFISRDGADAVVLGYPGLASREPLTVRPRGLTPAGRYDVWDPLGPTRERRTRADLAEHGLRLDLAGGAAIRRLRRANG